MSRLVALRRGSTLFYVVQDHLGGTVRVAEPDGDTIDDIRYHAFGETRSGGANLPTDKRFTGQILDLSTGLYGYGSRAYDPYLNRVDSAGTDKAASTGHWTLPGHVSHLGGRVSPRAFFR